MEIKDSAGVNVIMRDMVLVIREEALNEELDGELSCSKDDYRNRNTQDSWNWHSSKSYTPVMETWNLISLRIGAGEFELQNIKKCQYTVTQDMEEMIISMYAMKGV